MDPDRRGRLLLVAGALTGLALASWGLLAPSEDGIFPGGTLPEGAIARVGDTLISRASYERALAAVAGDSREAPDLADQRRVLERLIDEELLIQRGLDIGLASSDVAARKAISNAMIQSIVAESEAEDAPSPEELRHFHAENQEYFRAGEQYRVERIVFRGGERWPRAREARLEILAGTDFAEAQTRWGDSEVVPLPGVPLPAQKLRDYLGETLTSAVVQLRQGEVSEPLESTGASMVSLFFMAERRPAGSPSFEEVAAEVEVEYRRRRSEEALRQYLEQLRGDVEIHLGLDVY